MKHIKKVANAIGLKKIYYKRRDSLLRLRGFALLNLQQTISFMVPYKIKSIPGKVTVLPKVINIADDKTVIFPGKECITDMVFVWEYQNQQQTSSLSKYGSIIIDGKVLTTDRNYHSFYKDIWKTDKRSAKKAVSVIALFSQFQDGAFYGGYYDFVFLIATKLSRIKDSFPNLDLSEVTISYPLFNTSYETEYLQLLDVNINNLADSCKYKVTAPQVITGNSAQWYPNLTDIISLKQHITAVVKPTKTESNRIYISRSGRRHIINEDELIVMLKKFDFQIIEDKPRTVSEQISIYKNASFIIGPHGASFSNIIWCEPGTHLLELFSCNYAPDFFLYLATVMKMGYSAYYEDTNKVDYLDALVEDISVSVPKLEAYLSKIFST